MKFSDNVVALTILVGVTIIVSNTSIASSSKPEVEIVKEALVSPAGILTLVPDMVYSDSISAVPDNVKSKLIGNTDSLFRLNVKVMSFSWFSSISNELASMDISGTRSVLFIMISALSISVSRIELGEIVIVSAFS